jgi:hypothetical protein
LKSLPPYEDERSESSDAESTSSRISKPRKRSTIENDPDKEVKINFEDNGPIVLLDPDDESVVETSLTSQFLPSRRYMEWGVFTEAFDEEMNMNDDIVIRHIATKQVHEHLSDSGSIQDRWAQIRKNAAERVPEEIHSRTSQADDGDTSGEESESFFLIICDVQC